MAKIPPGLSKEDTAALKAELGQLRSDYAQKLRTLYSDTELQRKALVEEKEIEEEQLINSFIEYSMRGGKDWQQLQAEKEADDRVRRQETARALKALEQEQGNWITLKSGRKVLIKKK